jgi:hypothetical protein
VVSIGTVNRCGLGIPKRWACMAGVVCTAVCVWLHFIQSFSVVPGIIPLKRIIIILHQGISGSLLRGASLVIMRRDLDMAQIHSQHLHVAQMSYLTKQIF